MTDEMTWPQFKHAHSGMENEEISKLWKRFKEGKYMVEAESSTPTQEAPRKEEEIAQLAQIQPVALESDSVGTQDQSDDEAKSGEGEIGEAPSPSEPEEEQIEPAQSEETPPEPEKVPEPIPEPVAEPKPTKSNTSDEERLTDYVLFGI